MRCEGCDGLKYFATYLHPNLVLKGKCPDTGYFETEDKAIEKWNKVYGDKNLTEERNKHEMIEEAWK